jgi:Ras GTPase-activating-like protein IQGAP2/3
MSYPDTPTSPNGMSRRLTNRNTNRYSVTALFSMAAEQDVEVEDDLARGMSLLFWSKFLFSEIGIKI